jgi:hypothetical protein
MVILRLSLHLHYDNGDDGSGMTSGAVSYSKATIVLRPYLSILQLPYIPLNPVASDGYSTPE